MNEELSKTGSEGLRKRLDQAVVLERTVEQLRKDLREEDIQVPSAGDGAFEELRAQVLQVLGEREREGPHAFGLVANRVDLTEQQLRSVMAAGGLHAMAGAVVLRCLQKVLSRMRHAGLA